MKVLVGGLHHESDTFNPIITTEKDVRILRGEELINHRGEDSITGIIETLKSNNIEVVPTLLARAVPNGEWDPVLYESLKSEIIEKAMENKVDGICLALHGSMRIKGKGEAEGDILESIRKIYPHTPIVTSLDMHATVSKKMLDNADAFVGYKTAPHVDERETGVKAAELLIHALNGGRLTMSAFHIPFLVAGEKSETSVKPMNEIMERVKKEEREDKILSISLLMGFPWADTADGGVTVIAVTNGDKEKANKIASSVAEYFWRRREEFVFYNETKMPEEAPSRIMELIGQGKCPVVVSDSGDNPTAGSSQDNTEFLKILLSFSSIKELDPPLVYQAFYDPELLEKCFIVGEGNIVEGELGALFDKEKSSPLKVRSRVKKLLRNWGETYKTDLALIDVEGIDVIVTNQHVGCYEVKMMDALGIDIRERKAVVVKLGYLEIEIRTLASSSFMVLTKGSSDEILERLPYKKIRRPIWPLDKEGDFKLQLIK